MLYIIGTPIGNLGDISYRAAKTLTSSEIILAEDTRSAQTVYNHIVKTQLIASAPREKPKIISYYKDNEFQKLPHVLSELKDGKTISLISEAGMPVISDPGFLLMKHTIKENIPYTVIPGPSAVTTALLHSGFKVDTFMFIGFLPKKKTHLEKVLRKLQQVKELMPESVFVAFESPHRIKKTLATIDGQMSNAEIVVTRELTKKFEEVLRGTAEELQNKEYKGEITIVIS